MKKTKIIIIGAGIAGITAAIYLKRSNADFILIEGMAPGGKLNQIKKIENYPGVANTTGLDLQLKLLEQLKELNISITYGKVQNILKNKEGFEVVTDVDSYECNAVIICSGQASKSIMIKGEKEYIGMGVSYCATCDGNFFKNQDVAVIGNNDIAIEESLYLSNIVKKVYLFVKEEKLEGTGSLVNKIKSVNNIEIHTSEEISEIIGNEYGVTSVKSNNQIYDVTGVFPYIGTKTSTEFLSNLNPDSNNNCMIVDEHMKTNIDGLYAAGDIVDKHLKQLVTAASDGANAATNAFLFVKQIHL